MVLVVGALAAAGPSTAAPEATTRAAQPAPAQGMAKATAVVARVAPGVGNLELASELSVAVTDIRNTIAQAQAQAIDLGLIGTSLTAGECREGLRPEDLPQPLRVDNRGGDISRTEEEVPAGAGSGGRMHSSATTKPSSRAVATAGALGVDGLFTLSAGRAESTTEIDPGVARQARGIVEIDLDLAGVVSLQGLRWTALHRTGTDPTAVGTFEVAGAAAAGIPLPLDDIEPLEAAINEALGPTGVRVELPRVVRITEPADLVRVTPMRIVIQDSPLGATLLGPILDASRGQRGEMFDVLADAICEAAGILLVGDIVISIMAGTGFLALELGGVEAMTSDLVLGNPFGDHTPFEPGELDVVDDQDLAPPPATEPPPAAEPAEAPVADEVAADLPTAPVSAVEQLCESVHPFQWPSCSHGAAMPLALLGLAATAAVAALDWRHQRRRLATAGATGAPA